MIVQSIRITNFRCILDATLNCESLTAMVGANGAGKSSFLRALELFYATSPRFTQEDFYNGDAEKDIEISLTFKDLEPKALEQFDPYLDGGTLSVTRVLSLRDGRSSAKFYGVRHQNPDFAVVRGAGTATLVRQEYTAVRQRPEYAGLPQANSQAAVFDALRQWELEHPGELTRQRDDGQFFGFTEVGQGYLGQFTRFISVPAVRDAAEDAMEGKGRTITEILDLVVRAALANRNELKELKKQAQEQYDQLMAEATAKELQALGGSLNTTLKTYVPDAEVELSWITEGGVEIALPKADVKLVEHGYATAVARAGHGLQRAFILAMLQRLAAAQVEAPTPGTSQSEEVPEEQPLEPAASAMPCLVLGIEEPELYQHPSRQRHLANILMRLATGAVPGVAETTQVIYTTHSPLFVGVDRFDQIRVLRKVSLELDMPKVTKVIEGRGDEVAEAVWRAGDGRDNKGNAVPRFTWKTLQPRLQAIMTPWMAEGFFADVVVLVEGEDDRAAVLGTGLAMGHNLESQGFSVIPCCGKASMDRPAVIFGGFGIPTYLVWDSDRNGREPNPLENHRLLRIQGNDVEDWPCSVSSGYACFENKLEDTMRSEIGDGFFDDLLIECQGECGISKRDDALKNPYIVTELVKRASKQGRRSQTLESIIEAIVSLKPTAEASHG